MLANVTSAMWPACCMMHASKCDQHAVRCMCGLRSVQQLCCTLVDTAAGRNEGTLQTAAIMRHDSAANEHPPASITATWCAYPSACRQWPASAAWCQRHWPSCSQCCWTCRHTAMHPVVHHIQCAGLLSCSNRWCSVTCQVVVTEQGVVNPFKNVV